VSEPKPPDLLPILQKESDHPCFQCARCCTYVAIEIDAPTTMREYDYVVWYLYHEGVSVFVDFENAWYVKFETRCRNLTNAGLCAIYERRPAICKDFDWRECENHLKDEPVDRWLFEAPDAFLAWLAERRPKAYQRYQRFLRRKHADDEEPELHRISAARPAPAAGSRRPRSPKRAGRRRG
jgi:Fe-S-cluster containining protein